MATRLFLSDTANALSGTFPTVQQTAVVTPITSTILGQDTTIRTMRSATSASMVTRTFTSTATTAVQRVFQGYFCSDTIQSDTLIPPQTCWLNISNRESSTNMNLGTDLRFCAYVWRPDTGSVVGYLVDGLAAAGDAEPTVTTAQRVNNASITSTATVSAAAGDVIIVEVYQIFTQAAATAYVGRFGYGGTTVALTNNTTVTNHAAFFELSTSDLVFGAPLVTISASFGNTLSDATLAGVGAITAPGFVAEGLLGGISWNTIGGTWDDQTLNWDQLDGATLDALTLGATGTVATPASEGTFNNTLAAVTLSGTGVSPRNAAFSNTLAAVTLSGTGVSPRNAAFGNTLAAMTLSGAGNVPLTASFNGTLAAATLGGTGDVDVAGSYSNTLAALTLAATGSLDVIISSGTFNNTLADASLAATGASPRNAAFSNTLAPLTLSSTGAVPHTATFNNTLGAATLGANGAVVDPGSAIGQFNNTLAALMLAGTGVIVTPVPVVPQTNQGAGSGGARASQRKKFTVPSNTPRRSPVERILDPSEGKVVEPEPALKLVPVETTSMAKQLALAPYPTPVAPTKTKVVDLPTGVPDEDEYSDIDMIMLALLA